MTKEILQPEKKEVVKRSPFSRVALAGLAAVVLLTAAELTNKFVSAEPLETGNICSVGVNIRGVKFIDIGGEKGVFDPSIDREVGPAGNFTARVVALDRVTILGETFVGADGIGTIRGIRE